MTAKSTLTRTDGPHGFPRTVLFVGTSYPASDDDWKGLFLQRLLEALASRQETRLTAWLPPGPMPSGVVSELRNDDATWLQALMARGGIAHLLRDAPLHGGIATIGLLRRLRYAYRHAKSDIVHVNWLQNALPLPDDGKPVLISVLGTDMQLLRLPFMRSLLHHAMRKRAVALCPNADWMVAPLTRAFGDIATVRAVPFGIDAAWYGIERDAAGSPPLWLAVSRLTSGKLGPLFEWCEPHFAGTRRELHLFGPMQEKITVPHWLHYHGSATPTQLCREWFPRASGLVSLSRHAEGRPQVMLEAMAAALPILASRQPAHEDIVDHGRTGWLCDDPAGLAEGIAMIENPARNRDMGLHARDWARQNIGDWDDCAGRYASIYQTLLGLAAP